MRIAGKKLCGPQHFRNGYLGVSAVDVYFGQPGRDREDIFRRPFAIINGEEFPQDGFVDE